MPIEPKEVHVWSFNLTLPALQEKEKLELLSLDEKKRAQQFRFAIHKTRFIAAHAGFREIAASYLNEKPAAIKIAIDDFKKPSFADHPDLQFNFAHSHDLCMVALTRYQPIGIDVEFMKDTYHYTLVKRYFHPQEIAALEKLPEDERTASFYRLWSRKEALIKAAGKGMSIPLDSFAVSPLNVSEVVLCDYTSWSLVPLATVTGYQAALATREPIQSILYRYHS